MKKYLLTVLVLAMASFALASCGSKYCQASGCPSESASGSSYCYYHKCSDYSCNNMKLGSFSYCQKCIERAQ